MNGFLPKDAFLWNAMLVDMAVSTERIIPTECLRPQFLSGRSVSLRSRLALLIRNLTIAALTVLLRSVPAFV